MDIDIAQEKFSASGLMIIERNYLDVYPYDKWNTKVWRVCVFCMCAVGVGYVQIRLLCLC